MPSKPNIVNNRYGRLVVLEETPERNPSGSVIWKCQCDCGNITTATTRSLLSEDRKGMKRSCGCLQRDAMKSRWVDRTGEKYGRLTLVEYIGNTYYLCKCKCGTVKKVRIDGIRSGAVVSCGCYNKERVIEAKTTHGMSYTKAYKCADSMKRSNNKTRMAKYLSDIEQKKLLLYYKVSEYLGSDWEVDHIIPISKGGAHHPNNIQVIPKEHNRKKSFKEDYKIPRELVIRI